MLDTGGIERDFQLFALDKGKGIQGEEFLSN